MCYLQNTVFPHTSFCSLSISRGCGYNHFKQGHCLRPGTDCSKTQCHNGIGKERLGDSIGLSCYSNLTKCCGKKQCCKSDRGESPTLCWEYREDKARPRETLPAGAPASGKVTRETRDALPCPSYLCR